MTDGYLVALKQSVFRETPFTRADFGSDFESEQEPQLSFESEAEAETWVADLNREHTSMGQLTLHTAHPSDKSDVDAYLVFHPAQGVWIVD